MRLNLLTCLSLLSLLGGLGTLAVGIASVMVGVITNAEQTGMASTLVLGGLLGWFAGVCMSKKIKSTRPKIPAR